MTPPRVHEGSLRLARPEISRLAWAVAISLAIHLLFYGGYQLGKQFNLWQSLHLPAWMRKLQMLAVSKQTTNQPPELDQVPLMFVDVNPQVATVEPPKNTKFYSNKNSEAGNPDMDRETGVPKITGKQTEIVKAEDTPRSPLDRLQPSFPGKEQQNEQHAKPKERTPPGDLAMAKPETVERRDNGTEEQPRPRTIREALARRNQLVGEKMKQDGGVNRLQIVPGFDAKATPFGNYDANFIEIVQQRWYDLLDQVSYDGFRFGEVELEFRLDYKGRITDMKVAKQNVGDMLTILCEKAVLDPAPYEPWPQEMRQMANKDYRELHWTFLYKY